MFDHVINPAIMHINKLLNEPKLMRNCKYLCLVGGFSCSKYFQYRMNKEFGTRSKWHLDVIIPKKPILSVVTGAAYFGITKNYIRSRILRQTYGIKTNIPLEKAIKVGLSKEYIDKHSYRNDHKQQIFVSNYFRVMGRRGQEIMANTVIRDTFTRSTPNDTTVTLSILCSDLTNPLTTDDAKELGVLKVDFYDQLKTNMEVSIEFDFSETVIKVFAMRKNNVKSRSEIELMYLDGF